jgi:hypothetical protein
MRQTLDIAWHSRGTTWLWDEAALPALGPVADAWSLRRWLRTVGQWPNDLPGAGGQVVLVAGLDMALDAQPAADAETWLRDVLKPAVLSFQAAYDGGGALVFWLPTGRNRMKVNSATDAVTWACGGADHGKALDFGRILWGAAGDYPQQLLLQPGGAPAGLFHARIT